MKENVSAYDAGLILSGYKGPLSYYLDARMFMETHENQFHPSYDREMIDRQSEDESGSIAYSSFSRHRFNVSYDMSWGRVSAARNAVHWGPGIYSNLVFNQGAVPFNHLTFTTSIGPIKVISLYGQLAIDGVDGEARMLKDTRSIYAHRYEFSVSNRILLGLSEQLLLYEYEDPFSFVPVVPLYIEKGTQRERGNNGNLAFDISYKFPYFCKVYSEFLVDDIQAPTSLFGDAWGNKWGWLAGSHFIKDWDKLKSGLVLEYSRLEPWVYTHFIENTAQSANHGYPLGNQNGPNSQSIEAKLYLKHGLNWCFSLNSQVLWKGNDLGSSINDEMPVELKSEPKSFISGVNKPDITVSPYGFYRWKFAVLEGRMTFIDNYSASMRLQIQY